MALGLERQIRGRAKRRAHQRDGAEQVGRTSAHQAAIEAPKSCPTTEAIER
jgi:hypothetical protein